MNESSTKDSPPPVSVVIPSFNGAALLAQCLDALDAQTFDDFEVILVDNGSTDDSLTGVRERHPNVRLVSLTTNTGFASAVNTGVETALGKYVALLNNDTVVQPDWLRALFTTLDRSGPEVGAVQSLMLQLDDPRLVDDAGDVLSWTGAAQKSGYGEPSSRFRQPREVFSVCAGAAIYRRSFLEEMRGFDDTFFAYLEDIDLGLRGRLAGYRYLFEPSAEVHHKGHGSEMPYGRYVRLSTRNRFMMLAKCIPLPLVLKHAFRLLYGQFYFLVAYRRPIDSLFGYAGLVRAIPHVLRERRRIARTRRVSVAELDKMLEPKMHEPPLRRLLARRIRRSLS
jgi:hypothetical protein